MDLSRLMGLSFAVAAFCAAPVAAVGAEPAAKIVRSVEKLAASQAAGPADKGDLVCRWATQTMTYQGVSHTRRVRVCQKRSWWDELVRNARPSGSRPRPG